MSVWNGTLEMLGWVSFYTLIFFADCEKLTFKMEDIELQK